MSKRVVKNPANELVQFIEETGADKLDKIIWRAVYAGISSDDYHEWSADDRLETLYFIKKLTEKIKAIEEAGTMPEPTAGVWV